MKKAPTTKKRKGMKIQGVEPDKKSSYTDKKGKTVELKRYKSKEYKRTTDPDATKETRRATRRTNTLELSKTKTKKDGTTKTKVKRAAGGTKKAERLTGQFKKGARKEGASDVKIERKSIAKMKKSPSKMKSPAKKPLVGKQKNLPEHLKKAILDAPAKMLSKSGMKMMKEGSPAKVISTKTKVKESPKKSKKVVTKTAKSMGGSAKLKTKTVINKKTGDVKGVIKEKRNGKLIKKETRKSPVNMKTPMKKSKQKVEQDYARNAIADYKAGKKKQGNYEKKKALELAAGESGVMMKNPMMMKTNQSGGGYAAKNPAAPARQLKKLGSILSKHMKSK